MKSVWILCIFVLFTATAYAIIGIDIRPKLTIDDSLCTNEDTSTSCDITLNLNEQVNLLITIGNTLPTKNKVDLDITVEEGMPYGYWVWFDGLKGEGIVSYDFEAKEETSESLIIKGGIVSDFTIRLTAEYPEFPEGGKREYIINVNVVGQIDGGVTRTPGLNWLSFSLIIFLASLILYRRNNL